MFSEAWKWALNRQEPLTLHTDDNYPSTFSGCFFTQREEQHSPTRINPDSPCLVSGIFEIQLKKMDFNIVVYSCRLMELCIFAALLASLTAPVCIVRILVCIFVKIHNLLHVQLELCWLLHRLQFEILQVSIARKLPSTSLQSSYR